MMAKEQIRKLHVLSFIMLFVIICRCESESDKINYQGELTQSFAAMVVADVDVAIEWYSEVFGLTTKNLIKEPSASIAILTSPNLELELLQLGRSLERTDLLDGLSGATDVQGFGSLGFRVDDMNLWVDHLNSLGIAREETTDGSVLIKDPFGNLIRFVK